MFDYNTERFKPVEKCKVEFGDHNSIYPRICYDTLTKVMYIAFYSEVSADSMTPLLNSDGKPMLYQEDL